MLELLFVGLFQAVAGDPEQTAPADTGETAGQAAQPAEEIDPDDTVRCRRIRDLGSRVRTTRLCMTEREEERMREDSRRLHNRLTDPLPSVPEPGFGG